MSDDRSQTMECAQRAREAATQLRTQTREAKDSGLRACARALRFHTDRIIGINQLDVDRARTSGTSVALIDRLTLDSGRLEAMAVALEELAGLPDPVGDVVRGYTLSNGLQVRQVRVPDLFRPREAVTH